MNACCRPGTQCLIVPPRTRSGPPRPNAIPVALAGAAFVLPRSAPGVIRRAAHCGKPILHCHQPIFNQFQPTCARSLLQDRAAARRIRLARHTVEPGTGEISYFISEVYFRFGRSVPAQHRAHRRETSSAQFEPFSDQRGNSVECQARFRIDFAGSHQAFGRAGARQASVRARDTQERTARARRHERRMHRARSGEAGLPQDRRQS